VLFIIIYHNSAHETHADLLFLQVFIIVFCFIKRQITRFTLRSSHGAHVPIGMDAPKVLYAFLKFLTLVCCHVSGCDMIAGVCCHVSGCDVD